MPREQASSVTTPCAVLRFAQTLTSGMSPSSRSQQWCDTAQRGWWTFCVGLTRVGQQVNEPVPPPSTVHRTHNICCYFRQHRPNLKCRVHRSLSGAVGSVIEAPRRYQHLVGNLARRQWTAGTRQVIIQGRGTAANIFPLEGFRELGVVGPFFSSPVSPEEIIIGRYRHAAAVPRMSRRSSVASRARRMAT